MTMIEYNKIPTTHEQQIELLEKRGLEISDKDKAFRYLRQISYYRLSAYFLPYQRIKNEFNVGTTFNKILDNYRFDRELRLIIFDIIERIEVAIRSQMTHILAHKYESSHWQDMSEIFKSPYTNKRGEIVSPFNELQRIIEHNCNAKNPEVFIKHYLDKYSSPKNPPSWMVLELLTIGELSRLYGGLKFNEDKQLIADFFGLHHTVFTSWLHTLTYVRNICAHHARLWNREFAIKPDILLKPKRNWMDSEFNINQRTFYFISLLKYLLIAANPNNHLTNKLEKLFAKYPEIPIQFMGIPSEENGKILDWRKQNLWK